jgi:hypothetical protein
VPDRGSRGSFGEPVSQESSVTAVTVSAMTDYSPAWRRVAPWDDDLVCGPSSSSAVAIALRDHLHVVPADPAEPDGRPPG